MMTERPNLKESGLAAGGTGSAFTLFVATAGPLAGPGTDGFGFSGVGIWMSPTCEFQLLARSIGLASFHAIVSLNACTYVGTGMSIFWLLRMASSICLPT